MDAKVTAPEPEFSGKQSFQLNQRFAIAAIPDAYVAIDDNKFGRRSAGTGFLEAVCRYVDRNDYTLAVASEADLHVVHLAMAQYKDATPTANTVNIGDQMSLSRSNALVMPGPTIGEPAWARRFLADDAYSIVGVTHTIATLQATPLLCRFIIEPVQAWDALICTTAAVRGVVRNVFDHYLEYLASRNIKASTPPIQLPVIPLGIHCDHFDATDARKAAARTFRQERQIADGDIVLLSFGRIDPGSKSHPMPLFLSAERAQKELGGEVKLHLVMAGTFPGGDQVRAEIIEAAAIYAPAVEVHWVDGTDDRLCEASWQAADIFISLSDNIQESFGLTPVEAMGAGLPCIVSDWNGYKETVVHDKTGFRIPTVTPDSSLGIGAHFTNRYCGNLDSEVLYMYGISQLTAVDIRKCAEAISTLARDAGRREEMGRLGRQRAQQQFAWPVVLSQYQELFCELEAIRKSDPGIGIRRERNMSARPELGDPLKIFGDYPSDTVSLDTMVSGPRDDAYALLDMLIKQPMCLLSLHALVPPPDMRLIIEAVRQKPCSISELCGLMPQMSPAQVLATCLWLAKYDLLRIGAAS